MNTKNPSSTPKSPLKAAAKPLQNATPKSPISDEKPLFLAIESSCDDSSVAIIDARTLECVFYETITQYEHCSAGGVVPELASRLHTAALPDILRRAEGFFSRLCAVGATTEPGLSVSLQSGVACAKALCAALNVPFVAINHLKGHICSLFLESQPPRDFLCLLVSGGHTQIIRVNDGKLALCAQTLDDSLGESFDKCAKMLGGPYPGGAWVSERASEFSAALERGELENARKVLADDEFAQFFDYSFTVPLKGQKERAEYSFSGLKNQVRQRAQMMAPAGFGELVRGKICYEFERAAIAHIIDKLLPFVQNLREFSGVNAPALGVVGGASANKYLREQLANVCAANGVQLLLAPLEFCADNARMIARAGVFKLIRGEFSPLETAVICPRTSDFARL